VVPKMIPLGRSYGPLKAALQLATMPLSEPADFRHACRAGGPRTGAGRSPGRPKAGAADGDKPEAAGHGHGDAKGVGGLTVAADQHEHAQTIRR